MKKFLSFFLSLVAGFFVGNGLPYYIEGSVRRGVNPSSFPDRPWVNVVVGCAALAIGVAVALYVSARSSRWVTGPGALLGFLVVGLIHANNWDRDPWGKNLSASATTSPPSEATSSGGSAVRTASTTARSGDSR